MLVVIAIVILVVVGVLAWRALRIQPEEALRRVRTPQRSAAPDDDPEFLRRLGERVRRRDLEDPPTSV